MSTFTNILQQNMNNLQAQIRQLQEQNYNLRRKARWLMEAAASSDVSMLQQPEVQGMPQTPSGLYGGNPDRYTMGTYATMGGIGDPAIQNWPNVLNWANSATRKEGDTITVGGVVYTYHEGPPPYVSSRIKGERQEFPAYWKLQKDGTWKLWG